MAGPPIHPPLPPYLGGWALASLAFTSPIVLSLLLVIMRLILAINSANASVDSAKLKLASGCLGLEQAASVAVSFPHYLADNMNEVTASGAEALVHGLSTVLDMSVLAVEQVLIFIVDMYRSLYLCLVELLVRGSMVLAIGATEEFTEFFNNTVAGLRTQIQEAVTGANSALESAVEVINRVPGVDIDAPDLNPNLGFLNDVGIPDGFLNTLVSFNESLPTLDELKDKMNGVIAIPFEALRREISTNLGNVTVNRDAFPVPEKESLVFCQNLDYTFVDDVGHALIKVAQYGIIVVVLFIVLYISAVVFMERRWFVDLADYVDRSRATWTSDMGMRPNHPYIAVNESFHQSEMDRVINAPALLGFIGSSRNPLLRSWLPKLMNRIPPLRKSHRARSNATWFVSYITYTPALLLLAVSLLGILSIEIQLAALKPTEKNAQEQVNSGLSSFRSDILAQVNNATTEKSMQYANGSNIALLNIQNGINVDMFGWVDSTTTNINTTVNEFYDGLTDAITTTFRDTVFTTAALGLVNCLIGTKIEAISKTMTWLHDNAHVTLPLVSDNIFTLSPDKSDELVSSLDGSNPEDASASSEIVKTLVGQYRSALEQERTVFYVMLGLYGLVVLLGLLALLWHEKIGPRLNRRKHHPEFKDFKLEKPVPLFSDPTNSSDRVSQVKIVRQKLGILAASPLLQLREKKLRGKHHTTGTVSNHHARQNSLSTQIQQQCAFIPPATYPPQRPTADYWRQQPLTLSLLGALNLPDSTESRQSVASAQSSSAGMSPTHFEDALKSQRLHDSSTPRLPSQYLFGARQTSQGTPSRPARPASSANPFKTPFDDPHGV